jgi:hypothetical protein
MLTRYGASARSALARRTYDRIMTGRITHPRSRRSRLPASLPVQRPASVPSRRFWSASRRLALAC